jgi:hypothetical protein
MKDRLSATIDNIDVPTLRRICEALTATNRPASKGADPATIRIIGGNGTDSHTVTATTRNLIARAKDMATGARIARAVAEEGRR